MDRNFILAVALSFLVLVLYQSFFPAPKHPQTGKSSQVIDKSKDVLKSETSSKDSIAAISKPTLNSFKEEKSTIKTTNIEYNFTNVGGTLHNLVFKGNDSLLPLENILTVKGYEQVAYDVLNKSDRSVSFVYNDNNIKIIKTYELNDKNDLISSINIKNDNNTSRVEDFEINSLSIDGSKIDVATNKSSVLYEFSILENNKVIRTGNAYKFNPKNSKVVNNNIEWIGYRTHFHAFIIKPEFELKAYQNQIVSENRLNFNITPKQDRLSAGNSVTYKFTIVAGDQNIEALKKYRSKFEKIVAFNYFFLFDVCAIASYYVIDFLHMILKSWGIAILLFSILVYGLTYPMTVKSMASMKKMQLVQPKIQALQKRYKDDPKTLNTEMMLLYKAEGVNPLGGCLPMLLQMPLLVAVYQVLWRAYYFQDQSFLWIKNLTEPDKLFIMPFSLPFLGNQFNILPILVSFAMFIQQKASSKSMVIMDEQQALQQKLFKYLIPGMMFFAFYHMSSSWLLYFMVFSALSAWTQWKIANPAKK